MAILNSNTVLATIPVITKEERLNQITSNIKNVSRETFNKLIETQRQGIRLMWETPGITPQEIIDALGPDAIKVFQFHGGLTDLINGLASIDNVDVVLKYPTNAFTIDPNTGAITVTKDPYKVK